MLAIEFTVHRVHPQPERIAVPLLIARGDEGNHVTDRWKTALIMVFAIMRQMLGLVKGPLIIICAIRTP